MPNPFDRLKTALEDRYAIDRQLGAGGMATVYLAEDLKHHFLRDASPLHVVVVQHFFEELKAKMAN